MPRAREELFYQAGTGRIRLCLADKLRDLGSAVLEAQQRVAEKVKLPGGYQVEWVGEFGNLKKALEASPDHLPGRWVAEPAWPPPGNTSAALPLFLNGRRQT